MQGFTRTAVREAERWAIEDLGIHPLSLMENAGCGAAAIAGEMLKTHGSQPVRGVVVCIAGTGGNGGDALVVARHLFVAGVSLRIVLWKPTRSARETPEMALQREVCARLGVPSVAAKTARDMRRIRPLLASAPLIVDGIFGIGLTRPVVGPTASLIAAVNDAQRPVLALDLPSGLDCDTGEPLGATVRATTTVTFLGTKAGFANPASRPFTGSVRVVGIGAPATRTAPAASGARAIGREQAAPPA